MEGIINAYQAAWKKAGENRPLEKKRRTWRPILKWISE
jgi:hypothetical protein